jgi:hypothetical protein
MRKHIWKIVVLLLFCIENTQAQKMESDTITLKEVMINKTINKNVTLKTKGKRSEFVGFYVNEQFVSLIRNIPFGQINTLELFFNPNMLEKGEEVVLKLLIFDRNNQNKPGNSLLNQVVKFSITNKSKRKIILDLKELDLNIEGDIFFGFETINLPRYAFVVEFKENDNAISFGKNIKQGWFKPVREKPIELKMNLKVIPQI